MPGLVVCFVGAGFEGFVLLELVEGGGGGSPATPLGGLGWGGALLLEVGDGKSTLNGLLEVVLWVGVGFLCTGSLGSSPQWAEQLEGREVVSFFNLGWQQSMIQGIGVDTNLRERRGVRTVEERLSVLRVAVQLLVTVVIRFVRFKDVSILRVTAVLKSLYEAAGVKWPNGVCSHKRCSEENSEGDHSNHC
jgi:hypothetical protein